MGERLDYDPSRNKNSSGGDSSKKKKNKNKGESSLERARRINAGTKKKDDKKPGYREYWKGVRLEMSKVVWPTRQELATYTGVVIATCAVFALGFWLIDTGFLAALKAFLGITLS